MNKSELKACPFCDGRPEMDCMRGYRAMTDGRMGSGVAIYCTRCDCEMMLCREDLPECDTDELIEMLASQWNKRAGDRQPAVPETVGVKALASATGYAAIYEKLKIEVGEIEASIQSAHDNDEWPRYHRLQGSKDTLLNMMAFVAARQPNVA